MKSSTINELMHATKNEQQTLNALVEDLLQEVRDLRAELQKRKTKTK